MLRGIFSRRKAPPEGRLTVIGVRHHSPACARQVETVIRQLRPRHVLIEGPSDFNPHLADLRLPHDLPIAIFSYHADGTRSLASYTPFCRFSPEWRALSLAWEIGATPLFCDLPAWHPDFGARSNRYADLCRQPPGRWPADGPQSGARRAKPDPAARRLDPVPVAAADD